MSEEKRIAIFYDGYYFYKVNQYYERVHKRNAPIKIAGLHRFIVSEVANELKTEISLCRIVESHYFMGTSPNPDRDQTGFEYNFTVGGVSAHRLPLMKSYDGIRMLQEKGVDVLLALEAYKSCIQQNFDILVLIAGDCDYVPLVKELQRNGVKVIGVTWDLQWPDGNFTGAHQNLLEDVDYAIQMAQVIDNRIQKNPFVSGLFESQRKQNAPPNINPALTPADLDLNAEHHSTIFSINTGYSCGYISAPEYNNIYFNFSWVKDKDGNSVDSNSLQVGMKVRYYLLPDERRRRKEEAANKGPRGPRYCIKDDTVYVE